MNKPFAIGLIIFFILVIAAGAIWLTVRPAPEETAERGPVLRFPFGLFGGEEPAEVAPRTGKIGEISESRFTLLSANPVAGFAVFKNEGQEEKIRWIERQTGHVFESDPKAQNIERISNTTIPKVFDAVWSANGKKAILKYFEGENTRIISAEFVSTSTKALILPANILDVAYAPDRERLLYLLPSGLGSRLIAANPDNTKQSEILTSPFQDWLINWPLPGIISFLSKPSGSADGFLFRYDIERGNFEKILGPAKGLETLWSFDGKRIIFSAFDGANQKPKLFLYDVAAKKTQDLNIATLVSKCAFSRIDSKIIYCGIDSALPAGLYPDDRLKGKVFTFDVLWKTNLESGEKNIISDETIIDVGQIRAGANDEFLYFTNQIDDSLWGLQISL